ncbi:MAG: TonB family protein [Crocinitomicaceae bacterium]|nr:TonB family protein [Crocinitomicaceae bacterium]
MIAKKNPRLNLERKRILFFNIGLLAVSSFVLAAFTYETPIERIAMDHGVSSSKVEYLVDYDKPKEEEKVVEQTKPEQQEEQNQQQVGSENAVNEQTSATSNSSKIPESGVGGIQAPGNGFFIPKVKAKIGPSPVVEIPEIDASFIGGNVAMQNHIVDVMSYPDDARELGDQGRVYVSFIVEKDGSVTGVTVVKGQGVCKSLDREAKRIVRSFPLWKPGEDAYGVVRTKVVLPINFILQN